MLARPQYVLSPCLAPHYLPTFLSLLKKLGDLFVSTNFSNSLPSSLPLPPTPLFFFANVSVQLSPPDPCWRHRPSSGSVLLLLGN